MPELPATPLCSVTDQEMEALLASLAEGVDLIDTGSDGPPAAPVEVLPAGWYVAPDEVPSGPLALEQVRERWEAGELGPDPLCWRPGLADWVPLRRVAAEAAAEP